MDGQADFRWLRQLVVQNGLPGEWVGCDFQFQPRDAPLDADHQGRVAMCAGAGVAVSDRQADGVAAFGGVGMDRTLGGRGIAIPEIPCIAESRTAAEVGEGVGGVLDGE